MVTNLYSARDSGDAGSILGSGRSPGGKNGNHSSILAWKIPRTKESGSLLSIGSQRAGQHRVTEHARIHVNEWLSPFVVHLGLSEYCYLTILQYKIKSLTKYIKYQSVSMSVPCSTEMFFIPQDSTSASMWRELLGDMLSLLSKTVCCSDILEKTGQNKSNYTSTHKTFKNGRDSWTIASQ